MGRLVTETSNQLVMCLCGGFDIGCDKGFDKVRSGTWCSVGFFSQCKPAVASAGLSITVKSLSVFVCIVVNCQAMHEFNYWGRQQAQIIFLALSLSSPVN